MGQITYPDKVKGDQFFGTEATEIKNSVNTLYVDKNIWYVSKSGLDPNIGSTKAEPFLTIEAAHTAASADDIIEILDSNATFNESFTVTKRVIIKGPHAYNSTQNTRITGTWTVGTQALVFENVNLGISIVSTGNHILEVANSFVNPAALTSRNCELIMNNCTYQVLSGATGLRSIKANVVTSTGLNLQVGSIAFIDLSRFAQHLTIGLDAAGTNELKNSALAANLTITGNLTKENSTVGGVETVSGTTTPISQVSTTSEPNTWYLNDGPSGDDDNIGNDKFPFETIQAAHDAAAEGDILFFQNRDYVSTSGITITKSLTLKGSITANDNDIAAPFISGTWDIAAGKDLMIINLWIASTFTHPSASWFLQCTGSHLAFAALPTRKTKLIANNCLWELGGSNDLFSLLMNNTKTTSGTINIGSEFIIENGSTFVGNIVAGIDSSSLCHLKNSSIEGNVTVTGDLLQVNGVITGTPTISGTPTSRQAKVFDDSVEFKKQISAIGGIGKSIAFSESIKADSQGIFDDHTQSGILTFIKDGSVIDNEGLGNGSSGIIISDGNTISFSNDFSHSSPSVFISGERYLLGSFWDGVRFNAVISKVINNPLVTKLFEDDFTGTTINVGKWTITNPNSTLVTITQDDELELNIILAGVAGFNVNRIDSSGIFSRVISNTTVISFDVRCAIQDNDGIFACGMIQDTGSTNNRVDVTVGNGAASNEITLILVNGGSVEKLETFVLDISTTKTMKIVVDSGVVSWYYWNGSTWTLLSTIASTISASMMAWAAMSDTAISDVDSTFIDNYVITDNDFNTLRP